MNNIFLILPIMGLLFIGLEINSAFADNEYEENFVNPNGSFGKIIYHAPRIHDSSIDSFIPFIFTEVQNHLIVETNHGSVKLDKTECVFEFYSKGIINKPEYDNEGNTVKWNYKNSLFSDSIVPLIANEGTMDYSILNSINNESCVATWDGSELAATKQKTNVGIVSYVYILDGGKWKTELRVTNNSTIINKQFGFTQTIDLHKDTVNYGGQIRNLDDFDGQSFDRTWIENNDSKIIDFRNGYSFDFDLGIENLNKINIFNTGAGESRLSFDYIYNQPVVLPGETLIIDPALTDEIGGAFRAQSTSGSGADCDYSYGATWSMGTFDDIYMQQSSNYCGIVSFYWDISSIPNGSIIDDVIFTFDVDTSVSGRTCEFNEMDYNPTDYNTNSDEYGLWHDIVNGTSYVTGNTDCNTIANDYSVDLGTSADTKLESDLIDSDDEFAIGVHWTGGENQLSGLHRVYFSDMRLTVTYSDPPDILIPPDAPTLSPFFIDLTSSNFTSTSGLSYGNYTVKDYGLQCELNNAGGWLDTVSNSTLPVDRTYTYTGLSEFDELTCQWRDGSLAGWSDWSNNATVTMVINSVVSGTTPLNDLNDWLIDHGGVYFGMGLFTIGFVLIGVMASPKTVPIFTIFLMIMAGVLQATGIFELPAWFWGIAIILTLTIVLGRKKN